MLHLKSPSRRDSGALSLAGRAVDCLLHTPETSATTSDVDAARKVSGHWLTESYERDTGILRGMVHSHTFKLSAFLKVVSTYTGQHTCTLD